MGRKSKNKGVTCTASLLAQTEKNLTATQEVQVQFLSWDPLRKGMATHSNIVAWGSSGQRRPVGYSPWGRESRTRLSD